MIAASVHRFGRSMPNESGPSPMAQKFLAFCKLFIMKNFRPVTDDDIKHFGFWLRHTPYIQQRKAALARIRLELTKWGEQTAKSESFIKWEGYLEPKQPRAINSYTDESKVIIGMVQHAIDQATFRTRSPEGHRWFVKGSNPRTWRERMQTLFGDQQVMETDFSSFEAHHTDVFSEVVWFFVMHMLRNSAICGSFKRLVRRMMMGVNRSTFRYIETRVDQRLMSGAMWTSWANGVLNLLLMNFMCAETLFPDADLSDLASAPDDYFSGFVEGDDAIMLNRNIDPVLIKSMNIDLKFEIKQNFGEASFCGIVCDLAEPGVVTDPIKILRKFNTIPNKYLYSKPTVQLAYLRAICLSYATYLMDCPVVGQLCYTVLRRTRGFDVTRVSTELDSYRKHLLQEAIAEKAWLLEPHVTMAKRMLVERHFDISIEEQLRLEEGIRSSPEGSIYLDLSRHMKANDLNHALNLVGRICPDHCHPYPKRIQEILDAQGLEVTDPPPTHKAVVAETLRGAQVEMQFDSNAYFAFLEARGMVKSTND
nr:RNA-dependent RNA polymerase [Tolivirales sp.]